MRRFSFERGQGCRNSAAWITVLLAIAVAMPVWAQDDDDDEGGLPAIDEIIVTATKREQSIQDIPIAVSAYDAEQLTQRGVEDLTDLQGVSPSLIVGSSNSNSNGGVIRIRGMGTSGNNAGLESAVGVFIDGIFRSRAGLAFQDLVDIERVEVLRGPQGTLFGKNTSAGAVSIITKKPQFDFGGWASASYGSDDAQKAQASITGPIIADVLAGRLAGSWHERDGYFEVENSRSVYPATYNALLGGPVVPHPRAGEPTFDSSNGDKELSGRDRYTLKGQLLWTPSEDFDMRLILDYTRHDEDCCPAAFSFLDREEAPAPTFAPANAYDFLIGVPLENDPKSHKVGANFAPIEKIKDKGVSLEVNWDINSSITMTTVLSLREFEVFRTQDVDFSEADVLQGIDVDETWDNWSAEVRFVGTYEGIAEGFDWIVGLYAFDEEVQHNGQVTFGSEGALLAELTALGLFAAPDTYFNILPGIFPAGTGNFDDFNQQTRSYAIFTHNTLYITQDWDFTLGARFTWEEKEASQNPHTDPVTGVTTTFTDPNNPDPLTINNHSGCVAGLFISLRNNFGATCDNFAWKDEQDNTEWSLFASLGYQVSEDHNVYLSFAHGFKSGGWNANANSLQLVDLNDSGGVCLSTEVLTADLLCGTIADGRSFDPEFTNNFELGIKSKFLDGALTVNTTLFHTVFKNFQLQTFTGLFFFIDNVPRVKARGVEVEGMMLISENTGINFGVTYADTRYGSNLFITPEPPFVLNHNRIASAPLWSGAIGIFSDWDLPEGWVLATSGNLQYRGRRNNASNLDPRKHEGDFTRINVTIGFRSPDDRWEINFWGENLFDTRSLGQFDSVLGNPEPGSGGFGNLSAFVSAGRFLGVTVKYTFGEGA